MRDYTKALGRKLKDSAPRSGAGAQPQQEPPYKYWRVMKFVLEVDQPIKDTVVSSISEVSLSTAFAFHLECF